MVRKNCQISLWRELARRILLGCQLGPVLLITPIGDLW